MFPPLSARSAGVDTRQDVMMKIRRLLTCEALAGTHLLWACAILVKAAMAVCVHELWEPAVWLLLPDRRKEMVKIAWLIP